MKLYTFLLAPNGQRVTAFLKEKKISIDAQEINVREGVLRLINELSSFDIEQFIVTTSGRDSLIPFLKLVIPLPTSPISPEIFPRPNNTNTTTAINKIPGKPILFSI